MLEKHRLDGTIITQSRIKTTTITRRPILVATIQRLDTTTRNAIS
jgi:hypothetical protein